MEIISKLYKEIFRKPNKPVLARAFPDDIFIVGYPKSGNTWIRFLIGNYTTSGQFNFQNSTLIIPEIDHSGELTNNLKRPRIFHTHATVQEFSKIHPSFSKKLPKVIFIARDGRDVAVSYYYHLLKHFQVSHDMTFSEYLKKFDEGVFHPHQPWGEYINAWMVLGGGSRDRFLIVKYEDLLVDAKLQLRRIAELADFSQDEGLLDIAVNSSSFDRMRGLEIKVQDEHDRLKETDRSIPFIRSGKIGQWRDYFSPDMEAEFNIRHFSGLSILGYLR